MAIPGGNTNFTVVPDIGNFVAPNNTPYNPLSQIIRGGIAINNPSQGRNYQDWEVFYNSGEIKIKPVTGSVQWTYAVPSASIVSGSFDQNMNPVAAWLDGTVASIYFFFNTGYTTLNVNDVTSCRLVVDDIRDFYSSSSDIFFAYTKNDNNLYYRIQRQNYATEYTIGPTSGKLLKRMGLTTKNRVQFELLV